MKCKFPNASMNPHPQNRYHCHRILQHLGFADLSGYDEILAWVCDQMMHSYSHNQVHDHAL